MRVVTFNIRLGRQKGLRPVVELLRELAPDVVALQEVGANWREGPPGHPTARLAQQTGLSHRLFVPAIVEPGKTRYGQAVLSRWPLRNVVLRTFAARGGEPRRAAAVDVVRPGTDVRLLATHLSHIPEERARQGPELLDIADDCAPDDRPYVVAGDLNEPYDERSHWFRTLLDRLHDAGRCAPAPTFENPSPDERIDYLLASGARWRDAGVPHAPDLSDHRPVWADLDVD